MTTPQTALERDVLACVERLVTSCETSAAESNGLEARSTKRLLWRLSRRADGCGSSAKGCAKSARNPMQFEQAGSRVARVRQLRRPPGWDWATLSAFLRWTPHGRFSQSGASRTRTRCSLPCAFWPYWHVRDAGARAGDADPRRGRPCRARGGDLRHERQPHRARQTASRSSTTPGRATSISGR